MPAWTRTVRVRLAVTYSALVFGFAAIVLLLVYAAVSSSVEAKALDDSQETFYVTDEGKVKFLDAAKAAEGELVDAADLDVVQAAVNDRTLDTLRTYTGAGLGLLFCVSLGVGWWVAGRVLRPVEAITATAREITASDLSRRIGAEGPPDELRTLADTVDDMLGRLQASFSTQRALVDDITHELRNPLAVIRANVDAVLSDERADPEDRRASAEVVSRATTDMSRLLDDLLATARERSGAFDETEVSLADVARRVAAEYRVLAEDRGLEVTVRDAEGPTAYADEVALVRALRNLLSNAVRFSPPGGELTVAVGSRTGWAWIGVRDEGPGISADDLTRVFDRSYTTRNGDGDGEGATNGEGSGGLGLAIARQIVEAHDGRLTAFSEHGTENGAEHGTGSTFVMWLPDRAAASAGERGEVPATDPLGRR